MKMRMVCTGIALMTTLITTSYASPKMLTSYDQLLQAVSQGDNVEAVINFDKCTPKNNSKGTMEDNSSASTRINFTIFSHYKVLDNGQLKYAIATSMTILTEHRTFGPVYAYGRLRVFEDNTAELHNAFYDPKTFELKSATDYICHISNGADQNAVKLFDPA